MERITGVFTGQGLNLDGGGTGGGCYGGLTIHKFHVDVTGVHRKRGKRDQRRRVTK